MRPFLLENRDQHKVQLVEKSSLLLQGFVGAGALDDEVDHKVANPWEISAEARTTNDNSEPTLTLLSWQDFPSCYNNGVEHLQAQV